MTPHREAGPAWTATETLFIGNAGIVLAAPYLPRLFSMLDLATDRAFHSPEHAARGAHLIQCLVEGRPDRPEHLLPLNKILCGLGESDVLPASIQPTPREEEVVSGLLLALIQNWGALGSTTTEGLQESFFQREGALRAQGEAWRLQVEPRAFDLLIDRIPWSFNIIRFGWMDRVLHVDWRG
jgi:hypothetical protein